MIPTRRVAAFCLALLVFASTSACSDDEPRPEADPGHSSSHDPSPETSASPQEGWNDADAAFLEGMIPHHEQALQMAVLAQTRAQSPEVRALAARIAAAQAPEILVMSDWLVDQGLEVPDHAHRDMDGDLHGMLSDDQMAALADADGAAFDELFLTGMVQHHEGAVAMALTVLSEGEDQRVNELAGDVNATQTAEIARMESLLAGL
ncbi:hypothetical protein NSZ01_33140 [Nocardioides szechwanensis]|uniref:Uncharacterized conserved protein, DUF305 family n=1 Tax=Nocardioides szechwanensis TaxID=1005944 RepID=A0A1H0KXM2_9ACTN|nr:DUF305 domain-containing protein [Nocardioides szechwanensis]GEP35546.1 hypothetical protein NSZ01_33140 [Nocardioides szechwanensis]SDO60521.1 Uncharacterized conserved protein, DUF305 family [Nocardioides szechwanensis]